MSKSRRLQDRPRLCFVGPMTGRNPGHLKTPGELLSDKFAETGYPVISVSPYPNRYHRLLDIVRTLIQRRNEIDIMVLQVYGERSFVVEDIASRLGKSFGNRIVMFLHGGTLPDFFTRFPKWSRRVLARADALVAPSPFLARAVAACGFQAHVIPNILDLSAYAYRHRVKARPRLLWMRAFYSYYNPFMAVRVLARLSSKIKHVTLVMAGHNNGMEPQVRELAEKLGVAGAMRFPGFLDQPAKLCEANEADIFLNTNQIDNMPVSVLEACAMGLPVIATKVGGIPDLLANEKTALLVADDDDEAMAEAICRLLDDPELCSRLSANGRELAERCSWERLYPLWARLFDDMAAGYRSRPAESLPPDAQQSFTNPSPHS